MNAARLLAYLTAPRLTERSKRRIAAQRALWRALRLRAANDMMQRAPSFA